MSDQPPTDDELRRGQVDPKTLVTAGLITELIVDVHALARGVTVVADELVVARDNIAELRSLRRRNAGLIALAGALVATLVIGGIVGTLVFLGRLADALDTAQDTNRLIAECTSPAPTPADAMDEDDLVHECYDAALAGRRDSVARLDNAAVDAAICATQDPGNAAAIDACYVARSTARQTTTTTTSTP